MIEYKYFKGLNTDYRIVDDNNNALYVHKCVLSAISTILKDMISSNMGNMKMELNVSKLLLYQRLYQRR